MKQLYEKIKKPYLVLLILIPVIIVIYSVVNNPIILQCELISKGNTKLIMKDWKIKYTPLWTGSKNRNYFQFNSKHFKFDWDKKNNKFLFKSKSAHKHNKEFASYTLSIPLKTLNILDRSPKVDSTNKEYKKVKVSIDRVDGEVTFNYRDKSKQGIKLTFYDCAKISAKKLPKPPKAKF
tara:strand:+ start:42 stop:578 length:537 start_codon:yes stop_codon:yes gene_type:complete